MRGRRLAVAGAHCLLVALLAQGCSKSAGEVAAEQGSAEPSSVQSAGEAMPEQERGRDTGEPGAQNLFPRLVADPAYDPLTEYDQQCPETADPSLHCEWLRSLVVASAVRTLEGLEQARDQRAVDEAMLALDVVDEPVILVAGLRILGQFPDTPGLGEKVTPLLDSPWFEVQKAAANVLSLLDEPGLNTMANKWKENHIGVVVATPYDELAFPEAYGSMGFPEYPGMERYTPGDSDRSLGWWSPDAPDVVAAKLAGVLGVQPMGWEAWMQRSQQELVNAVMPPDRAAQAAELQKLMEQYMKSSDPKLMERIERMSNEMDAAFQETSANADKTMAGVATPTSATRSDQIYCLIAEEKAGHTARMVLIYRQPIVERTVIQMSWDLRDYPPAWSKPM